jgi:Fe-S cluster biogenesis protein NfuA
MPVSVADAGASPSERVARLLEELTGPGCPQAGRVEELVRALTAVYGEALTRVVSLVDAGTLHRLAADPVVSGMLVLHDLHPVGTAARVSAALDAVRPALGKHAGGVELLGVDEALVVHLRLEGSCDGCPSSLATVRGAIERAVFEAAPEVSGVEVAGLAEQSPALLQIQPRPAYSTDGSDCPAVVGAR